MLARWMLFYADYQYLLNILALLHVMFMCPCIAVTVQVGALAQVLSGD